MSTATNLYLLMQINDSVFPIGSYNHSYGLETYIAFEKIRNHQDAISYILAHLKASISTTELLASSLAFDYTVNSLEDKLYNLDQSVLAIKSAKEIREASLKLGNRFLKTINSLGLSMKYNDLLNYPIIYGSFCASINNMDKRTALSFQIYNQTSALVTNCVKTVPLSQTSGQQILYEVSQKFDSIINNVLLLTEQDLGLSTPSYDIRCMQHETLYSRLYMS